MANLNKPDTQGEQEDEENQPIESEPKVDWFLRVLVNIANNGGPAFGVTLTVRGVVISGILASGRQYFEAIAEGVKSAVVNANDTPNVDVPQEARELMAEPFRSLAATYPDPNHVSGHGDEAPDTEQRESPPPAFIHLRDARIFAPGQPPLPQDTGVWWRGRLSAVDGFWLGNPKWMITP